MFFGKNGSFLKYNIIQYITIVNKKNGELISSPDYADFNIQITHLPAGREGFQKMINKIL
jgi:hypothetical protein